MQTVQYFSIVQQRHGDLLLKRSLLALFNQLGHPLRGSCRMVMNPLLKFLGGRTTFETSSSPPPESYAIATSSPELGGTDDVEAAIDAISKELHKMSLDIHQHPELFWRECRAHDLLADYMAKQQGFKVTRSAYGLATAMEVGTFFCVKVLQTHLMTHLDGPIGRI